MIDLLLSVMPAVEHQDRELFWALNLTGRRNQQVWHRFPGGTPRLTVESGAAGIPAGVLSGKWKPFGEGEIEVTTTVDRHAFVIR